MTKVSILVPIYNVETYLTECLNSLISQSLKEIEIICINDGSTDNSPKILKKFAKKDPRIVVIDKSNSGYGDSMNRGLAKAKGEYIAIVESDDFANTNMCEEMYEVAKEYDADIVRTNYYHHTDEGDVMYHAIKDQFRYHPEDILDDPAILYEAPAIWSAIYRRSFLKKNGINFLPTPGASYQDTSFNMKALCTAERIVYTDQAFLHYRIDNSSSSVKSLEKVEFVVKEYDEVERYLNGIKAPQKIKYISQAAKFGAFHWNLQRLPRNLALDFLREMKQNFIDARQHGLIQKRYFPKKYWYALQVILRFPVGVYYSLLATRKLIKHS